jgi:glycosyltransferase involved in cell wall biosynthesis
MSQRIALVCPVFPPFKSSAAVQLWDLSREFLNQGYQLTVIVPSSEVNGTYSLDIKDGVNVLRLKAPKSRDTSYIRRTISEFITPYLMMWNLSKSPLHHVEWDGIVWYSPSIFLTPFVKALKSKNNCRTYLIVRDIFPEWAVNLGLMKRGPAYWFFKLVEYSQYKVANIIGVQTDGNLRYFEKIANRFSCDIEVLQNWLAEPELGVCSIDVTSTSLSGRKILVYAGNMGVAQDLQIFVDLANKYKQRSDIGFLFVGRGSEKIYLEKKSKKLGLSNILFFNEINSSEIPGLYKQCHVGIISLDRRHLTHNIPGKFLTYMAAGLPVLALLNKDNDLIDIIQKNDVGFATSDYSVEKLDSLLSKLIDELPRNDYSTKSKTLSARLFSPKVAVQQIAHALFE